MGTNVNIDWIGIAALVLALAIAAVLIILFKRGLITGDTITATGELMDSVQIAGDGFVAQLYSYARMAVRAVEQMVKNGDLGMGNEVRKAAAVDQVLRFAEVDGMDLGETDRQAVSDLIEAAVAELPKTHN